MKLAVLIDYLIPGGVQLEAIEQVEHLNRMGHQVTLCILVQDKHHKNLVKNIPHQFLSPDLPNLFIHPIKFPLFSFFSTAHLFSPLFIPKYFKQNHFDLIISHGSSTSLTALAIKKYNQTPFVAIIHDPINYILKKSYSNTPLRFLFPLLFPTAKYLEKSIGKNASTVIIDSSFHEKRVKKSYQQKPVVLSLGLYPKTKLPKKRGSYILALSRWQKEKNPFLLASLLAKLPKARLILAGSWLNEADQNEFKRFAKNLKVKKRITIIPKVNESQKQKLFAKARCWVHPNLEAFGLGGLEAAANGVPIIMPKKSGVATLFKSGKQGYFPKKATLESFLPPLTKLLKNERLAWKMGYSAWQTVKTKLTWEKHTQKLLKIIKTNLPAKTKKSLLAIEIGHLSAQAVSGGDKLFQQMIPFIKDNLDISILIPALARSHWKKQTEKNINLITIESEKFSLHNNFTYFLAYLARIAKAINILTNKKFDVILSTNNVIVDVVPTYFYKRKHPQVHWIARIHHLPLSLSKRGGNFLTNTISSLLQNLTLTLIKRKADHIIALNPTVFRSLIKMNFPRHKLQIIGTGINLQTIHHHQIKKRYDVDAVTVGRLHPTKGIFDLPDIWLQVLKKLPNAKLAIIGEARPSILLNLKREFIKRNIENQVKIMGYVPEQKLYDVLKSSLCFLMTDHEAGWSLASAEAMACGLPVIAYKNPIFGNVFKSGFITAEVANKKQFARRIIYLLTNQTKRKDLKIRAKEQASQLDINNLKSQIRSLLLSKT